MKRRDAESSNILVYSFIRSIGCFYYIGIIWTVRVVMIRLVIRHAHSGENVKD